ncbi:MAG TPA: hypothetical protein VGE04_02080 [Chloroflexia bacterium]
MDSTLVAAIIGVAGALLGVALTRFFDLLERRAKHQEWLDEFRLPKQIDALSTLYTDTVRLFAILRELPPSLDVTQEALTEAQSASDAFNVSTALAYIYLSDEARSLTAVYQHNVAKVIRYAAWDLDLRSNLQDSLAIELIEETEDIYTHIYKTYIVSFNELIAIQSRLLEYIQKQLAPTSLSSPPSKWN